MNITLDGMAQYLESVLECQMKFNVNCAAADHQTDLFLADHLIEMFVQ